MKIFRCSSTQRYSMQDYESLIRLFYLGSKRMGLKTISLGKPCGQTMRLSFPVNPNPNLKNLLVVAGIHGEEPAGSWATVKFLLSENPELASMVNISILPVFNPSGFINSTRNNSNNERTNILIGESQSEEGKIIQKQSDILAKLGYDCVLSLHENNSLSNGFYIYANTDATKRYDGSAKDSKDLEGVTADLIDIVVQRGLAKFKLRPDGKYTDPQGKKEDTYKVKDGVVTNLRDNSFEDYMNRVKKVPIVILPETPSKNQPIEKRVSTHLEIIRAAAHYLAIDLNNESPEIIPVIKSKQTNESSCGGGSLHSVLRYYDINETEKKINEMAELDMDIGIEPESIVKVAKQFGLSSKLIKGCNINTLKGFISKGIPVIVAIVAWGEDGKKNYNTDKDGHWVVVIGFDKARVYIEDPALVHGRAFLDWYEFEQRWHDVDGEHVAIPIKGNQTKPSLKSEDYKYFRIS